MLTLISSLPDSIEPDDMPLESTEITQDQLLNYQLMHPIGQDKSIPWISIIAYENMKAKRMSELKKWKEQVGFLCKTFRDHFSRALLSSNIEISVFSVAGKPAFGMFSSHA